MPVRVRQRAPSRLSHSSARSRALPLHRSGELLDEPRLDQLTLAADGGPPIDRKRRAEAKKLTGEKFDACVLAVLGQAKGTPVGAAYLSARVGGPRWKLQASLRRLVDAKLVERSGTTSATRYWINDACEESRP